MNLTLHSSFLSIVQFPPVTLPKFSVLTGLNGTGKTHVLQAIQNGHIKIDIAKNHGDDIRYFDWNSLVPNESGVFDGHTFIANRMQIFNNYNSAFSQHRNNIINAARINGVPTNALFDAKQLTRMSTDELAVLIGNPEQAKAAHAEIKKACDQAGNFFKNHGGDPAWRFVNAIASRDNLPLMSLDSNRLFEDLDMSWGNVNPFQQSFSQLFVAYRDLLIENDLKRLAQQKGESEIIPLTDEEFTNKYNLPPWDFVNKTFKEAGLDFEIDRPYLYRQTPYQTKLTKKSTGAELNFGNLSSGEKILMAFALCLYYSRDTRQIAKYPHVLLFDEIDATLHPSMSKILINIITGTLVNKHNISVILTTHSPSTVAVAPEEAIHVMRPNMPGIHKVSKSEALNILTYGVPTLSLSFSGRRQVFVESSLDSDLYDRLYQALKPRITSERSLVFIAAGQKSAQTGTDISSGCTQVKRVVEELSAAGNQSVLGLIDWDKENKASNRLFVIAEGKRYSIENCIFDPLLLAALLIRDYPKYRQELGLKENETYRAMIDLEPARLQEIADSLQNKILGTLNKEPMPKTFVDYLGGFKLSLSKAYLEENGHDLQQQIITTYPELQSLNRHNGDLMRKVIDTIIVDSPQFLPKEILLTLEGLLNTEIAPL